MANLCVMVYLSITNNVVILFRFLKGFWYNRETWTNKRSTWVRILKCHIIYTTFSWIGEWSARKFFIWNTFCIIKINNIVTYRGEDIACSLYVDDLVIVRIAEREVDRVVSFSGCIDHLYYLISIKVQPDHHILKLLTKYITKPYDIHS